METIERWNKFPSQDPTSNLENKKKQKIAKDKTTEDFQESMQEDMRGPMEGMEAIPPDQNL